MIVTRLVRRFVFLSALLVVVPLPVFATFTTFESGQVRPLALSPDGARLYAVNTPDDRLEIFDVGPGGALTHAGSVPVGLEPVAVAAHTNAEVWVVNHLSDSVSVVDAAASPPHVTRTLLVGDEPRDIVFAGAGAHRAFITTAHRGQNSPVDPELTTEGRGRADVWVFDALDLGVSLGGTPLTIITLFADTPRALAVSPSGNTVYAAAFHSGNQTTTVPEGAVCNGGALAPPCNILGTVYPGGLPAPNANIPENITGPETGLIVKFNPFASTWLDTIGRDWSNAVKLKLPDHDVFTINASATPKPVEVGSGFFPHVGTVLLNMVTNPVSGKVYVSNTDAHNEVRFEGPGGGGSTVRGHLHEARITVLDGASVFPRHLNKHLNYSVVPTVSGKDDSLAIPTGMAVSSNGTTLYVAAFGSGKIGIFNTTALENNTFTPSAANHITVAGGGPSGVVLSADDTRLYALTRFDNAVSVIDTATKTEIDHLPLYNPEPPSVRNGRSFLYDAVETSSNGEASCASCHIFGDFDSLAWDLGNPDDVVLNDNNPRRVGDPLGMAFPDFHPLKGPMTTQSLRGMANAGPMHWRGDRTGSNDAPNVQPNSGAFDEDGAFKKFNVAFGGLLGRSGPLTAAQMQAFTNFILQVTYPPNPVRNLDNTLTPDQQAGLNFFLGPQPSDVFNPCDGCHVLASGSGFFGTDGFMSFEFEPQFVKIPHLRNLYQKVGMFGMTAVSFISPGDNGSKGDQVRGFGFLHDGSVDTIFRFHSASVFNQDNPGGFPLPNPGGFPNGPAGDPLRRQVEQFMLAFDTNLAPIVGQQITLSATNALEVWDRIDLLVTRASIGECELTVKGTLGGVQRGWLKLPGFTGPFQGDNGEPPISDTDLRIQAFTPGQERTYTCVPPGSGTRVGIDRDEDGVYDRTEIDAGTDPADPATFPSTTTTVTSTTTTTTFILISTKSLSLRDDNTPPVNTSARKVTFKSGTKGAPAQNRVVPPVASSFDDPRLFGGVLTVYNSAGLSNDEVTVPLYRLRWHATATGFQYRDAGGPISKIVVKPDTITVKGGKGSWLYTLDEPSQNRVAVRLQLGARTWCADAPAKATGNPPTTAQNDHLDRFVAQTKTPPPGSCPPLPSEGSPSGAFLDPFD